MTDYYTGLLIGAVAGYCVAFFTMIVLWSLCVIAKTEEEDKLE